MDKKNRQLNNYDGKSYLSEIILVLQCNEYKIFIFPFDMMPLLLKFSPTFFYKYKDIQQKTLIQIIFLSYLKILMYYQSI